ncbi:hypothetical protein ACTRW9_00300 [Nitrospina sp. 32_T5]|uniref:hypothetical protein n=1 Tax=unclassified Nitrospina TaxID=2638683 RepID=UPI003F995FA5
MLSNTAPFKNALYLISLAACIGWVSPAQAFPVDDAFPLPQEKPRTYVHEHPRSRVPMGQYPSLNPNLSGDINDPHPFPDYMKRFIGEHKIPKYYYELIQLPPQDQVQSKVFNPVLFSRLRRIGVVHFENKIPVNERDPDAGKFLAGQVTTELETLSKLNVIPPQKMVDEFYLQITHPGRVLPPVSGKGPKDSKSGPENSQPGYDLPYAGDKMDAVLIGAVTRFSNQYEDRHGKKKESLAASVEFGAFLISTETGEVIWAARYVGTQRPRLGNLFKGQIRWLSKQEFSQEAIKKTFEAFDVFNTNKPGRNIK